MLTVSRKFELAFANHKYYTHFSRICQGVFAIFSNFLFIKITVCRRMAHGDEDLIFLPGLCAEQHKHGEDLETSD